MRSTRGYDYSEYDERDRIIFRNLRMASYKAYLKSDLWQRIRAAVLALANGNCEICGRVAVQVHHVKYTLSVLRGSRVLNDPPEPNRGLVAICDSCHVTIEFDDNGRKRSLSKSAKRLKKLLRSAGKSGRIRDIHSTISGPPSRETASGGEEKQGGGTIR